MKVQHKQIRPSDSQNERSHVPDHQAGYDDQMMGAGYGQSLPPSGAMAGSNNGWFVQEQGGCEAMPEQHYHQQDVGANDEAYDGNHGGPGAGDMNNNISVSGADPLSGLEPLRQALPEVGNEVN